METAAPGAAAPTAPAPKGPAAPPAAPVGKPAAAAKGAPVAPAAKPGAEVPPVAPPAKERASALAMRSAQTAQQLAESLAKYNTTHAELEKLKPAAADAAELKTLRELAKANPAAALSKLGIDYAELLKAQASMVPGSEAMTEVERLRAELAEKEKAHEAKQTEAQKRQAIQAEVATVAEAVKASAETFPLASRFATPEKVRELIYARHEKGLRFNSQAEMLADAMTLLEGHYEGQLGSVKELDKVRKLFAPAAPEAKAAPAKKKSAPTKTLTNRQAAEPGDDAPEKRMSPRDRLEMLKKKHLQGA